MPTNTLDRLVILILLVAGIDCFAAAAPKPVELDWRFSLRADGSEKTEQGTKFTGIHIYDIGYQKKWYLDDSSNSARKICHWLNFRRAGASTKKDIRIVDEKGNVVGRESTCKLAYAIWNTQGDFGQLLTQGFCKPGAGESDQAFDSVTCR